MDTRLSAVFCVLLISSVAPGAELPEGSVQFQPARWRAVRMVIHETADQTGFRWAMPDTLSRRAWTGSAEKKEQPTAGLLQDVCKQTGLRAENLNDIFVFHTPKDDRRKELVSALAGKDKRGALQAIMELGWLGDARAWPELANAVAGTDLELALAAAHALRRLDGEKNLDWRLFGVSQEDPEFVPMTEGVTPWQTSLGAAFPDAVRMLAIEKLAASSYLPLREAAARLAACQKEKGKAVVEKLVADPSPTVRAAAERTLAVWAEPKKRAPVVAKKPDPTPWYLKPAPDLKAAAEELAKNKDHDTVWRLVGRRVAYQGTPEAVNVMLDYGKSGGRWSGHVARPLVEWCGGAEVVGFLKAAAVAGHGDYDGRQAWALWGLSSLQDGEELAQSLRPVLESRSYWASPPEYTAARGSGIYSLKPLLARMDTRGHWVCLALGYIGGPDATDALIAGLNHKDPGVAVAAAKGLGAAGALAGVKPLIDQLKNPDRLRRHWAVLGLAKIGGPEAAQALTDLLVVEEKRQDRLVRKAAAQFLQEMGPLSPDAAKLVAKFETDDKALVPEYRPRNAKFDDSFPVNAEVTLKEHHPVTYCSIGETRAVMDWANHLMIRYGGCSPCYSNECFAFDVGTSTWFPIRAADHYCHLFNEVRPNPGCSRGMAFDGIHKWVWIGPGIGSTSGPTVATHNLNNGLSAYDPALDRFVPCANAATMAKAYSGEPAKFYTFDYDKDRVVSSSSGGMGVGLLDAGERRTFIDKAPEKMPSWDQYRPPAFCYDPIAKQLLCTHPDMGWKLLTYDFGKNSYHMSETPYPGTPNKQNMGGLVYDSVNREMILIGGVSRENKQTMPTCRWDRKAERWLDLEAKDIGKMGVGQGTCVYDPEHNIILELISGTAYRYKQVSIGTRAYCGGSIGKME